LGFDCGRDSFRAFGLYGTVGRKALFPMKRQAPLIVGKKGLGAKRTVHYRHRGVSRFLKTQGWCHDASASMELQGFWKPRLENAKMPRTTRRMLQPIFYSDGYSIPDSQSDSSINSSIDCTTDSHVHSINIRIFKIQARINALYVRSLSRLCHGIDSTSTASSCESSTPHSPRAPPASPVLSHSRLRYSEPDFLDSLHPLHHTDSLDQLGSLDRPQHWPFQSPCRAHELHVVDLHQYSSSHSEYESCFSEDELFWDAEDKAALESQPC